MFKRWYKADVDIDKFLKWVVVSIFMGSSFGLLRGGLIGGICVGVLILLFLAVFNIDLVEKDA